MPKRSTKFYRKNEMEVMDRLGLKGTKNSGAGWIEKEDGYNDYILSQLKSTDAESIKINLLDIQKLEYNSAVAHKIPVFVIQFIGTDEVFVLAKPMDLPNVSEYLKCGKTNIENSIIDDIADVEYQEPKKNNKVISSGNRKKFWAAKEKEWKNRR